MLPINDEGHNIRDIAKSLIICYDYRQYILGLLLRKA